MSAAARRIGPALLADLGGTHARFALGQPSGEITDQTVLPAADFAGPVDAAGAYLDQVRQRDRPRIGAFSVACPVFGDHIALTNNAWRFSIETLRQDLKLDRLDVINDFTTVALAIPRLGRKDTLPVGGGAPVDNAPIAAIGPGTGLGVSGLIPAAAGGWTPLRYSEGGHVTLAPATDRESAVVAILARKFGHVSAERAVSGPGLVNLYRAVAELNGRQPDATTTADSVTARAQNGTCPDCTEALDLFIAFLATMAANLALTLGARGGVYIAGGIVPRLGSAVAPAAFRRRFENKGRFSGYLAAIPTRVIVHPGPAFLGLMHLLEST